MVLEYRHYRSAEGASAWRWANFTPAEMRCRGTGKLMVDPGFMDRLQAIRNTFAKPITVVSGYRSPAHNLEVTSNRSQTGAHTYGRAVDIALPDRERDVPVILHLAKIYGMTRCGLMLTRTRFKLHLDDMTAGEGFAVSPDEGAMLMWTY